MNTNQIVHRAIHWFQYRTVSGAVYVAMYDAVSWDIDNAVHNAMRREVYAEEDDPPHSALCDFLADTDQGAP